jgi:hypothetical protein
MHVLIWVYLAGKALVLPFRFSAGQLTEERRYLLISTVDKPIAVIGFVN